MADVLAANEGMLRAAEALLRVNGGRSVVLRFAMPPAAGDVSAELGLEAADFQEVELAPAVFRKTANTETLMVSAKAVATAAGVVSAASADALFQSASGAVVDGVVYAITSVKVGQAMGSAYCYVLGLRAMDELA